MNWTKTSSTEPGWYWWRYDGWDPEVVHIDWDEERSELWQFATSMRESRLIKKLGEWFGPLDPPP